ncbi:MAG: hypothetical protein KatS3mg084_0655 [Candidatus Dojkabacteria bacterium]|nr:MAG: hypothetical protein KatS3mg084_0655 [Candidatus Dojkabacteria bacterium]
MAKIKITGNTNKELVLNFLKLIPRGKVVSFSQIGSIIHLHPRIVGFILTGMNQAEMSIYPWHRVVNRKGFISACKLGEKGVVQKKLLEMEGIPIQGFQIIEPEKYFWRI